MAWFKVNVNRINWLGNLLLMPYHELFIVFIITLMPIFDFFLFLLISFDDFFFYLTITMINIIVMPTIQLWPLP